MMSTVLESSLTGDVAAGSALSVKRKSEDPPGDNTPASKEAKVELPGYEEALPASTANGSDASEAGGSTGNNPMSKARGIRLEQNRKAARESRRRKKTMIEELQRSVIFFSRANSTLKQQNDELSRLLIQSQTQVAAIETGQQHAPSMAQVSATPVQHVAESPQPAAMQQPKAEEQSAAFQQAQAQAVATQAVLESQGYPAAAARAAAQTINAGASPVPAGAALTPQPAPAQVTQGLAQMQPGATMQAMASFQQAAAAAMQAAMQGMQGIPGVNMATMAAAPVGTNAQQAYTDTMTAFAMQQAAAAAAGQQVSFFPGAPFMMWPPQAVPQVQQQQQQVQVSAPQAASPVAPQPTAAEPVGTQPVAGSDPSAAQPTQQQAQPDAAPQGNAVPQALAADTVTM